MEYHKTEWRPEDWIPGSLAYDVFTGWGAEQVGTLVASIMVLSKYMS